jgi:hypothetical protein
MTPRKAPRRFTSFTLPLEWLLPGKTSRPTQIIPCCMAKITRSVSVLSLSPLWDAEFVNPPAILSRHLSSSQCLEVASMKAFIFAETLPM